MRHATLALASLLVLASSPASQTIAQGPPDRAPAAGPRGLAGVRRAELAGVALGGAPHFDLRRVFQEGETVEVLVDPLLFPDVVGATGAVYVTAARTAAAWAADPALVDATGAVEQATFGPTVAGNVIAVDAGALSGDAGLDFGVGYDVVVDLDADGLLSAGDLIDGLWPNAAEPGLFVVRSPLDPGPLAVSEALYSLGGPFTGQNLFYPSAAATLEQLPLVLISHGNGQSYQWFEHFGTHLASHGFVVLSHETNAGPGVQTAAASTLSNADLFLSNLGSILGGVLAGSVDAGRMVWMGYGRGGEGVVLAYRDLVIGAATPGSFTAEDVALLAALAPTDLSVPAADPGDVAFALWAAAADGGPFDECFASSAAWSFHLHDRADGQRQSLYLHGAPAASFVGGPAGLGTGPCLLSQADVHALARGYLLPLAQHHARGSLAAKDFLWRQWESFHPVGAPAGPCVVVDLTHREAPADSLVIDDFQSAPSTALASSGAAVTTDLVSLAEDRFDDPDALLAHDPAQEMNGMALGGPLDDTRGAVLSFTDDRFLSFDLAGAPVDASGYRYVALRAAQGTRHPLTALSLGDLAFSVRLEDAGGGAETLGVDAYGGGVEEPYQRTGCGAGVGWFNEMETLRLRLGDFRGVDLTRLARVTLLFGPSHGSSAGRVALDELRFELD
ncbi:MAG: hypothetical protein AAF682_15500 [Planctomycetota bacterium]